MVARMSTPPKGLLLFRMYRKTVHIEASISHGIAPASSRASTSSVRSNSSFAGFLNSVEQPRSASCPGVSISRPGKPNISCKCVPASSWDLSDSIAVTAIFNPWHAQYNNSIRRTVVLPTPPAPTWQRPFVYLGLADL